MNEKYKLRGGMQLRVYVWNNDNCTMHRIATLYERFTFLDIVCAVLLFHFYCMYVCMYV